MKSIAILRFRPSRSCTPKNIANSQIIRCRSSSVRWLRARAGKKPAATCWARCNWASCSRSTAEKPPRPGWDGDRYAVFEGPKGKLGLVWVSTWDSEDDAREFVRGYAACQSDKVENLGGLPRRLPDSIWRNDGDSLYVVERHGRDVIVVEGFSPQTTVALVSSARQAKKTELKPAARKTRGCRQQAVEDLGLDPVSASLDMN